MVFAPHLRKLEEAKVSFWDDVFHLVSCIPQNVMVVSAGDMNGHVESSMLAMIGRMVVLGMEILMHMDPGS